VREGGWIPLLLGVLLFLMMTTWRRGIEAIQQSMVQKPEAFGAFLEQLKQGTVARVPGTAVFFSRSENAIPAVMIRHVAQMKALQQTVVSLTVWFEDTPRVPLDRRAEVEDIAERFWHVTVRFGFMETPDVTAALVSAREKGCLLDLDDAVYFASHDDVVRSATPPRLPGWRRMLFAAMYRNAVRTPDRFALPPDAFLEVGRQIGL
jgi:KUP system potassium uptake protein